MTPTKRIFDLVMLVILTIIFLPLLLVVALVVLIIDGRPVFYISERMKTPTESIKLLKIRSMKTDISNASGVSGGDKDDMITTTGAIIRKLRFDELPQFWNILRGDLSFVGPRPPLRQYVEEFPELYAEVLKSRPGITGLATLVFHKHEERMLAECKTPGETDAVYKRRCIPRKARLDLIYQRNQSLRLDVWLMLKSVFRNL